MALKNVKCAEWLSPDHFFCASRNDTDGNTCHIYCIKQQKVDSVSRIVIPAELGSDWIDSCTVIESEASFFVFAISTTCGTLDLYRFSYDETQQPSCQHLSSLDTSRDNRLVSSVISQTQNSHQKIHTISFAKSNKIYLLLLQNYQPVVSQTHLVDSFCFVTGIVFSPLCESKRLLSVYTQSGSLYVLEWSLSGALLTLKFLKDDSSDLNRQLIKDLTLFGKLQQTSSDDVKDEPEDEVDVQENDSSYQFKLFGIARYLKVITFYNNCVCSSWHGTVDFILYSVNYVGVIGNIADSRALTKKLFLSIRPVDPSASSDLERANHCAQFDLGSDSCMYLCARSKVLIPFMYRFTSYAGQFIVGLVLVLVKGRSACSGISIGSQVYRKTNFYRSRHAR